MGRKAEFAVPHQLRYFEDYEGGRVYEFGSITLEEGEIIEFARRFDPQDMHIDPQKAREGRFGGLIASGWQTVGTAMRLYVEHYLSRVASLASLSIFASQSKFLRVRGQYRLRYFAAIYAPA